MDAARVTMENLTFEYLLPFKNQFFQIASDGKEKIAAELIEVTDLRRSVPSGYTAPRMSFSLVFQVSCYLPQKIYRVSHVETGDLDVFLVPIAPDARGHRMEAIFNLI